MSQLKLNRNTKIILASKSPRRRQLLEQAGLTVTVMPSDFEEGSAELQAPEQYVRTLAEGKARAVTRQFPNDWVIGADTIVVVSGRVLGKPASEQEARTMLNQLNGRTHEVFTGWCIHRLEDNYRFSETIRTEVQFKQLTATEIEWYIHTSEPFDKAGAYAIQGVGAFLVKTIRGSYSNVVGLPLCEVIDHLLKSSIIELNP